MELSRAPRSPPPPPPLGALEEEDGGGAPGPGGGGGGGTPGAGDGGGGAAGAGGPETWTTQSYLSSTDNIGYFSFTGQYRVISLQLDNTELPSSTRQHRLSLFHRTIQSYLSSTGQQSYLFNWTTELSLFNWTTQVISLTGQYRVIFHWTTRVVSLPLDSTGFSLFQWATGVVLSNFY